MAKQKNWTGLGQSVDLHDLYLAAGGYCFGGFVRASMGFGHLCRLNSRHGGLVCHQHWTDPAGQADQCNPQGVWLDTVR